jgi:hypothetical protein
MLRNTSDDDWRKWHFPADNADLTHSILICLLYTACWIPLWIIPDSFGRLAAGAFFVQSGERHTSQSELPTNVQVSKVPGVSYPST